MKNILSELLKPFQDPTNQAVINMVCTWAFTMMSILIVINSILAYFIKADIVQAQKDCYEMCKCTYALRGPSGSKPQEGYNSILEQWVNVSVPSNAYGLEINGDIDRPAPQCLKDYCNK